MVDGVRLLTKLDLATRDCQSMVHDAVMEIDGQVIPYFSMNAVKKKLCTIGEQYKIRFEFDSPDQPDIKFVGGRFSASVKTNISVFCLETGLEQAYTSWGFSVDSSARVVASAMEQGVKNWFCRQFLVSDPVSISRGLGGDNAPNEFATKNQLDAIRRIEGVEVDADEAYTMSRVDAARRIAAGQHRSGLIADDELEKKFRQLGGGNE